MPKTMATAPASLRPVLVSFAREGRDEQHIKCHFRKAGQFAKKCKIALAGADLPPVIRKRQSVSLVRDRRLPDIVVPLPQVARGDLVADRIYRTARKLAKAQISCCNIRHNRI
jgi:hypothetical protein